MLKFLKKCRDLVINPFDEQLKKAHQQQKRRFLIVWNRGLGDIALGLYAMVHRIKEWVPHAHIVFVTRNDLAQGFELLEGVDVLVDEKWKRGEPIQLEKALAKHQLSLSMFDVVIEKADPTRWVKWQLGKLTPKLKWPAYGDERSHTFGLEKGTKYIGVHVDSETKQFYGYNKNWEMSKWKSLFARIVEETEYKVILFGLKKNTTFFMDNIVDLRGDTDLIQALSVIKNYCTHLIVPDSGLLAMTYYLEVQEPLHLISLWSDPKQGVLKQKVASPNLQLMHTPLIGAKENINEVGVDEVFEAIVGVPV